MEKILSIETVQALIGAFLGIGMTQSGFDKIFNWKDNREWLVGHFSDTFLKSYVTPMLLTVTILEGAGGLLAIFGAVGCLIFGGTRYMHLGLILIAINLLALFFGQRIAKDYEGAAVLVNYFILTIIGLLTFQY